MHTIGIDMSKDTFHAAFDETEVLVFKNTESGIAGFIEVLVEHGCTKETTTIGTESTGVYHLLFCERLRSSRWKVKVLNPLITWRMFKSELRHAKTDRNDAIKIRRTLLTGGGSMRVGCISGPGTRGGPGPPRPRADAALGSSAGRPNQL